MVDFILSHRRAAIVVAASIDLAIVGALVFFAAKYFGV